MCKSKAAGTSTSKLGCHLQTKSLASLSAQNLFADFAKCEKITNQAESAVAMPVGCYALRQPRDTCAVCLLFLVMVQLFRPVSNFQSYALLPSRPFLCALGCVYEPTLNGSSVLQRFECGNIVELCICTCIHDRYVNKRNRKSCVKIEKAWDTYHMNDVR